MKRSIAVSLTFFFACCAYLYAGDYKWDLVNALIRNDYPVIENIITQNINTAPASEKSLIMNFAVTYSRGETTLMTLNLLQRYNVHPNAFNLYTVINMNQSDDVIQFILNRGVTANGEILLLTMQKQRFNLAGRFILSGVDVNYFYPQSSGYYDGMTCLLYASRHDNHELVRLLIERGADINARNRDGATALSIAQNNGNTQIINYLIEMGANQAAVIPAQHTAAQSSQQTALQQAALQQVTGGISGFLDSQIFEFQPGNYRLSGSDRNIRFIGTASYGTLSYIRNNRVYNGTYQTANENITLMMDGRVFIYKIDNGAVFSGHGETWVRIGA